jgi:hypothetical protein
MQPVLKQVLGPANKTTMLVLVERYHLCDGLAARSMEWIPVCIDHANMEKLPALPNGLAVPHDLSIGRLIYAMVRSNGQLLGVGEIFHEQPEARLIVADINAGAKWGVSLCTDLRITPDWIDVTYKKIKHLGVTKNPEYGDENTWIHLAGVSADIFYRELVDNYINRDLGMYVPDAMIKQLENMLGRGRILPRKNLRDIPMMVGASRELASNPESRLFPQGQNSSPLTTTFFTPSTLPDFGKSPWVSSPHLDQKKSQWLSPSPAPNTRSIMSAPPATVPTGDPMTGVTNTNPATPIPSSSSSSSSAAAHPPTSSTPAAVAPNAGNFTALGEEIKAFLKGTLGGDGNPVVGIDTLAKARQYSESVADYINKSGAGSNVTAWPKDSLNLLTMLSSLQETSKAENQEFAKKFYADNPQLANTVGKALENPLDNENLPAAALVFATKPKWEASEREKLTNQREQEAVIALKNQELELSKKREAEKDVNIAKMKADMETMNAKFAEFTKQHAANANHANESAAKRSRIDTTPIMNTGLTAAELAAAKGQQTSLLDAGSVSAAVGASQGTRSDNFLFDERAIIDSFGKSARVMHNGWINNFAPTPNKSADVENYKAKALYGALMGQSPAALGAQIGQL